MQILWKLKAKYMCFQYTEEKKTLEILKYYTQWKYLSILYFPIGF